MAQPQQQYHMQQQQPPQRTPQFSPIDTPQSQGQQQFPFPPPGGPAVKRQRLSPNPQSQPSSPYTASPYAMSPGASGPSSTTASPHFANVSLPPNVYNTPYANGSTPPTSSLPPPQQNQFQPQQPNHVTFQGSNHNMNQNYGSYGVPQQQPVGTMGPPMKPPEKQAKENDGDAMDILQGTGINLQEEENILMNNSFNAELTGGSRNGFSAVGHSYSQFGPGDAASFYGSGPANQPAVAAANGKSQEEYEREAADKAWSDAARQLATSRQREIEDAFLFMPVLQAKADKATREHGLVLKGMSSWVVPENFNNTTVNVRTSIAPNVAFVHTSGTFLANDTQLTDQVALLSLAVKQRLRSLVEDASKLAEGRQSGSHGLVPSEWTDAACAVNLNLSTIVPENGVRVGWESAVSSPSNSHKRSHSIANRIPTPVSDGAKTPVEGMKMTNTVVLALRDLAKEEREFEEARLRKRQARAAGGDGASRQGSVVPGTPGSVAPQVSEKAPTKKEQTKKAAAKATEAASHAAANSTTSTFLNRGSSLFGKKKKTYSWMTGGATASGSSTPGRPQLPGLGAPGGPLAKDPAKEKLTFDGVRRPGTWREDGDKGKCIQLRDWICVLEEDGRERKALQLAYMNLEDSGPK